MATGLPVGTVVYSMLTEDQFQSLMSGENWVLADGRSIAGRHTQYEGITASDTIPNLCGVFVRGKNNSRTDAYRNPYGELDLGAMLMDEFVRHDHGGRTGNDSPGHQHALGARKVNVDGFGDIAHDLSQPFGGFNSATGDANQRHTHSIDMEGHLETQPKSITLNPFIRIN